MSHPAPARDEPSGAQLIQNEPAQNEPAQNEPAQNEPALNEQTPDDSSHEEPTLDDLSAEDRWSPSDLWVPDDPSAADRSAHLRTLSAPEDWAWVEEWRAAREPVPWVVGVPFTLFVALVVGSAVIVLSSGLIGLPLVDVAVNLAVAAGLAPAVWLSRNLPVLRWVAGGAVLGVLLGWVGALLTLT